MSDIAYLPMFRITVVILYSGSSSPRQINYLTLNMEALESNENFVSICKLEHRNVEDLTRYGATIL